MQGYLGTRPQLERGALGSVVIAGGVKMKLLAIWFCGNQSKAKGVSEDRFAHLLICWRRTPRSPETACRQRWMTGLAGEREPLGGGGRRSTEIDRILVAVTFNESHRTMRSLQKPTNKSALLPHKESRGRGGGGGGVGVD